MPLGRCRVGMVDIMRPALIRFFNRILYMLSLHHLILSRTNSNGTCVKSTDRRPYRCVVIHGWLVCPDAIPVHMCTTCSIPDNTCLLVTPAMPDCVFLHYDNAHSLTNDMAPMLHIVVRCVHSLLLSSVGLHVCICWVCIWLVGDTSAMIPSRSW